MNSCSMSLIFGTFLATIFAFSACKKTSSDAKSIPVESIDSLTLEQWTDACQKELDNPATGVESKNELVLLASTTDCAAAYPLIKQIVDRTTSKKT